MAISRILSDILIRVFSKLSLLERLYFIPEKDMKGVISRIVITFYKGFGVYELSNDESCAKEEVENHYFYSNKLSFCVLIKEGYSNTYQAF